MTAYAVPPSFAHGDKPTAANLNKLSDGLDHVYELVPTYSVNQAVAELGTADRVYFTHRQRWVHYKSSGQILDPAGLADTVSLPNTSDDWANVYDLDQIGWLAYGAGYWVQGVDFALEDTTP